MQARISELSEVGTAFDLTPMVPPPEMAAFRHSNFWQDVMPKSFADDTGDQEDTTMLPSVMLVSFELLHDYMCRQSISHAAAVSSTVALTTLRE